ncbi:hypothetical protein UlMin_032097 [Ulmus minor]
MSVSQLKKTVSSPSHTPNFTKPTPPTTFSPFFFFFFFFSFRLPNSHFLTQLQMAFNYNLQIPIPPLSPDGVVSSPTAGPKPGKKRSDLIRINDVVLMAKRPTKKPDPGAPKITRPCSECGKKFWSWKALFGHMRCHPERRWRGMNPPVNLHRSISQAAAIGDVENDVAACLLLLANGSPPASSDDCAFECSSCKKVFRSHQALGGHRASHKNVKGCFAMKKGEIELGDFENRSMAEEIVMVANGGTLGVHNYGGLGMDLNLPDASTMEDDHSSSSYSNSCSEASLGLDLRLGL